MTDKIIYRPGIKADLAVQTVEDITLYVRSDGNDSNSGLSASDALATVQEAIDRLPKHIQHDVTIDIGEGDFDGFWVRGFTIVRGVVFTIQGTLGTPTLTTGTTSGTATGGSTTQLIDSGQNWTTNELRGMLLKVGSEYLVIRENTSTTIDVVGVYGSSVSGKAYEIVEQKTNINTDCPYTGISARVLVTTSTCVRDSLVIKNLKTTGGTLGFSMWDTSSFTFENLHSTDATLDGFHMQTTRGTVIIRSCYASGGSSYGFVGVELVGQLRIYSAYAYGATTGWGFYIGGTVSISDTGGYIFADNNKYGAGFFTMAEFIPYKFAAKNNSNLGLLLADVHAADIMVFDISDNGDHGIKLLNAKMTIYSTGTTISNNSGYGILLDDEVSESLSGYKTAGSFLRIHGSASISGNSLGGIKASNMAIVETGNLTGSNTGYGLILEKGARATITSQTAITGSSGDITIDDGDSTLSYSSDFATDGDSVANLTNGCRIERKD